MRRRKLPPDASPLAKEVYRRAEAMNIGQAALGTLAGLGDTWARDLYDGKSRSPSAENLDKIAGVLGCTVDDLLHPERSSDPKSRERYAQTEEEFAILLAWREGGDRMRAELTATVERVALGALARFRKKNDV